MASNLGTASRQSKYLVISETINRLIDRVENLEGLIVELENSPHGVSMQSAEIQAKPPSFVEIYQGLPNSLNGIIERLEKATAQLREILI